MMFPKLGKREGRPDVVKELDRAFSEFTRLRYTGPSGMCRCFTCPTVTHWRVMDAGHFIGRACMALRWDERNVRPQCPACNRFADGHQARFALALNRELGPGTADRLKDIHRQRPHNGFTRPDLQGLLRYYRARASAQRRTLGL